MAKVLLTLLVIAIVVQFSEQGISDNNVDDGDPSLASIASSLFADKGGDLGSMLSGLMASEGGKHMGELLLGGGANGQASVASDILNGIGSMIANSNSKEGDAGIDLSMIGNVLSALNQPDHNERSKEGNSNDGGFDLSNAMAFAASFMNQEGSKDMMNFLPGILNFMQSMSGQGYEKTAKEHAGHSWFLPPLVERIHIFADQFMNSDFGRDMVKNIGGEKFVKIFSDADGNFSYKKLVDLLENHSFRRHWIKMVTGRLADFLSYFADPYTQKKFLTTSQFFINNFLKGQGVPKNALFDMKRPSESLTTLFNYLPRKYLGVKFNSAPYVKPAVKYVHDLLELAENRGILGRAINSAELTHKLTDTINLEMIEPIARINRAVRFARKHPKCTKYVFCIANQIESDDQLSLPGLKRSLSKGSTLVASWYISGHDHIPFWTLYGLTSDGKNCEKYFHENCHGFHVEEEKVTTEYVHNEL